MSQHKYKSSLTLLEISTLQYTSVIYVKLDTGFASAPVAHLPKFSFTQDLINLKDSFQQFAPYLFL